MVPNTPRAVTCSQARGDRRGLADPAGRRLPQREADAGRLRRPRARPPRGPAPRRGGRALHQGASRPASRGDRDLGRGRGRPRGPAAAPGRRPHPVRQPGRRPLAAAPESPSTGRRIERPRRSRRVGARRRPQAGQRRAPPPGSAPLRSTSARGRDGAGPQGCRQAPRLLRGAAAGRARREAACG